MKSRRDFLKLSLVSVSVLATQQALAQAHVPAWLLDSLNNASADPWLEMPKILARIKAPVFPNKDFDITKFGAVGDGKTLNTESIAKAIATSNKAGGGRVIVPQGDFLTGAIHLKSNVNLHILAGGTIKFSRDPKHYLPLVFTRWEGMELMNYSPFLYAFEQENIGITGEGTIDGQSDCEHWWPWKGRTNCGWKEGDPNQARARKKLYEQVAARVPVVERIHGEGSFLRPQFLQPYRSKNILIEGVTLRGSPMWQVHPVLCSNVTVRKLTIIADGPNTDGCDPESCNDVLIDDCFFDTGDDCIAIKAGRNEDGRRVPVPSQNIIIRNCHMKDGHGGITIGSEISGGVRNVFAEKCQLDSPRLDIAIRFKNNALRGGLLENIFVRDLKVGQVAQAAIAIDFLYEEAGNGPYKPVLRNVDIRNITVEKADYAMSLRGLPQAPAEDIHIKDCDFKNVAKPNLIENVNGLKLVNVKVNGKVVEANNRN